MVRPLDFGAHLVVHNLTKYLSGHGDVLSGAIISDAEHNEVLHALSRTVGPVLGPFESYLSMRGIKTLAIRFERHCQNGRAMAQWLASHPKVERVYHCSFADHPAMASHRDFSPKARLRMGIRDNLVRLAAGIEAEDDIRAPIWSKHWLRTKSRWTVYPRWRRADIRHLDSTSQPHKRSR